MCIKKVGCCIDDVCAILQLYHSVKHPVLPRAWRMGGEENSGCVLHFGESRGKTIAESLDTVKALTVHLLPVITACDERKECGSKIV